MSAATSQTYASIWNRHLYRRVGHLQLRQITPAVVDRLKLDMQKAAVGAATIRKAMSLLQAILREAVAWDRIRTNPVKQIRKPRAPRQRAVVAISPLQVEALRAELPALQDKILVGVLAFAGTRPEDALALEVRHVGRATLLIEQKSVDGVIVAGQKVDRRRVPSTWSRRCGRTSRSTCSPLVAARPRRCCSRDRMDGHGAAPTTANWRRRVFYPAAAEVGLGTLAEEVRYVSVDGVRRRRVKSSYTGLHP